MSKAIEEREIKEAIHKGKAIPKVEEGIERPYTLRSMKDSDLFPLLQLLRTLGLKDFKDAWTKAKGDVNINPEDSDDESAIENIGIDIIIDMADTMISKIETHSDAIYDFYAGLSGIPAEEIKDMEFGTLPLMIYDSFCGVKNTAFFKVLSKLL